MSTDLERWIGVLQTKELPVLGRTVAALAELSARVNTLTAAEIAKVVYHDPLMTLKVITAVNGMRRGRISSDITTVEQAVMMVGINPFFTRFEQLAILEGGLGANDESYRELLRAVGRARHAAHLAWDWGVLRQDVRADEVYVAALLWHLGEIALWFFAPEQGMRIRRLMRAENLELIPAFREVLGFDLREFEIALARAWHVPDMYLEMMDPQHAGRPRVLEVTLATSIARRSEGGWYDEELHKDIEEVANLLHMDSDEAVARIHQQSAVVARSWEWTLVRPAAGWLPLLPGPWPDEPDAENSGTTAPACMMPRPEVEQAALDEINAHLDGTLDLHEMMALALKGMHEGLGLDRVLFALLTPDRGKVKAKYVLGAEEGSPLHRFEFDLAPPDHLFARLMGKTQALWFKESNREKLEPLILPGIRDMIGAGEFYVMSVHVHGKPVGLFYGDRKHGTCELDPHSYEEFKALSLKAAEGLGHLAKPKPH